jgi:hypothetical protein
MDAFYAIPSYFPHDTYDTNYAAALPNYRRNASTDRKAYAAGPLFNPALYR